MDFDLTEAKEKHDKQYEDWKNEVYEKRSPEMKEEI